MILEKFKQQAPFDQLLFLYKVLIMALMIIPYFIIIYGDFSGQYTPPNPFKFLETNLQHLFQLIFNNSFTLLSIFAVLTPIISILRFYNNYKNSETHHVSLNNPIKLINVIYHKQDVTFLFVFFTSIIFIPAFNYCYAYALLDLFLLLLPASTPVLLRLPSVLGFSLVALIFILLVCVAILFFLGSFYIVFRLIVPLMKRLFFPNTYLPQVEVAGQKYCIVGNDQDSFFLIKLNERYLKGRTPSTSPTANDFTETDHVFLLPRNQVTANRVPYFQIRIHFLRPYIKNFKTGQLEVVRLITSSRT
ncbi:hypothetical protein M3M35_01470 [Fructilactobacillus myrtifloralis]|uniref:Uncharacterized protein n=1 Tax=Fructilactobacillus myrtifloralis TaxID=2940301 RepID=A0ABY5BS02_9LACO|nr:hypothetical protein [Fructilactobacillus myrtifloralis]USS85361.1 hypothetical protein M3M35_01470 [Fructilactobacillus myrtifloralis]